MLPYSQVQHYRFLNICILDYWIPCYGGLVHCGMLNSIPGLHVLDANNTYVSSNKTTMSVEIVKCPWEGKITHAENHCTRTMTEL